MEGLLAALLRQREDVFHRQNRQGWTRTIVLAVAPVGHIIQNAARQALDFNAPFLRHLDDFGYQTPFFYIFGQNGSSTVRRLARSVSITAQWP